MNTKSTFKIPLFLLAIIIGLIYTYINSTPVGSTTDLQEDISNKIIRFHVVANSDSNEDYELKMKVKAAVCEYASPLLENSKSLSESENLITKNSESIQKIAENVILENGYNYPVYCSLCYEYFPTKSYGKYTFPAGKYKAFQIKIGEAKGSNWWCVLFPPMCFIDMSHGSYGDYDNNSLSEILTSDEYNAVIGKHTIKYKFKFNVLSSLFN